MGPPVCSNASRSISFQPAASKSAIPTACFTKAETFAACPAAMSALISLSCSSGNVTVIFVVAIPNTIPCEPGNPGGPWRATPRPPHFSSVPGISETGPSPARPGSPPPSADTAQAPSVPARRCLPPTRPKPRPSRLPAAFRRPAQAPPVPALRCLPPTGPSPARPGSPLPSADTAQAPSVPALRCLPPTRLKPRPSQLSAAFRRHGPSPVRPGSPLPSADRPKPRPSRLPAASPVPPERSPLY